MYVLLWKLWLGTPLSLENKKKKIFVFAFAALQSSGPNFKGNYYEKLPTTDVRHLHLYVGPNSFMVKRNMLNMGGIKS